MLRAGRARARCGKIDQGADGRRSATLYSSKSAQAQIVSNLLAKNCGPLHAAPPGSGVQ
jgi:hypothetical protein